MLVTLAEPALELLARISVAMARGIAAALHVTDQRPGGDVVGLEGTANLGPEHGRNQGVAR